MIVSLKRGIKIDGLGVVLDGNPTKRDLVFISHAHEDHLPTKKVSALTDPLTKDVANVRKSRVIIDYGISSWKDIKYGLFDAGHVPGSKMIKIVYNNVKLLYTGDFSLHTNPLVNYENPGKADIVILDSTYFHPYYVLPDPLEVIESFIEFLRKNENKKIGVFLYPYGKSQIIGSYLDKEGIEYFFHESYFMVNKIVEKHLNYCFTGNYLNLKEIEKSKGGVYILPLHLKDRINVDIKVGISGWAKNNNFAKQMGFDIAFPYSDHADFNSLLKFIDKVKPGMVYGFQLNGNKWFFEKYIREEYGIDAKGL